MDDLLRLNAAREQTCLNGDKELDNRQTIEETCALLASCRYRVDVGLSAVYACRHPAVRARDGVVTDRTCSGCELRSSSAEPRPFAATQFLLAYDRAGDSRNATEGVPYRSVRRVRDSRVRVGFVTPNLVMGGAERWIVNLLRYLDRSDIMPSGVALLNAAPADATMCAEAAEFAPLFGGPDGMAARSGESSTEFSPFPTGRINGEQERNEFRSTVIRFESADEALATLCRRSDVIVAWGSSHFARLVASQGFSGTIVVVAHGSAPSTARMLEGSKRAAQQLVGVSKAAAAAFRDPRAIVIHNGADVARCTSTVPRDIVRQHWGADQRDVLLGYVGRFSWEKNPLAAALAVRELNGAIGTRTAEGGRATSAARELGGPFRAVYIGGGAHEDEVRAKVRAIAPDSIFVPPVEQIGDALCALDAFGCDPPSPAKTRR